MTKRSAIVALVLALVGATAAVAAAYVHYQILFDPRYTAFCDINAVVSCTDLYRSRYATFLNTPVALFGAIWFVGAGLLSIVALVGRPEVRESISSYLFAMSTLALGAVLYLLYVSIFILKTYCPVCLTIDAAVIGLFVVSGATATIPMMTLPQRIGRDLRLLGGSPLATVIATLFVVGAVTTLLFFPREGASEPAAAATADQRTELENFMAEAQRIQLPVPRNGARVLIVKFNDFGCPACGESYFAYKPILARYELQYPGAVRMVTKDYPLNTACNPKSAMVHVASCQAAVAVRLAREHGREVEMEEWLYSHQSDQTVDAVRKAAREIGQITDFDARYVATLELVKPDVDLGTELGLRSTPTFFIDGVKVEGMWPVQYFDQAIAYELQHPPAQ
jgi:uncharacterized membrane protein/protein-disulfide isomerase